MEQKTELVRAPESPIPPESSGCVTGGDPVTLDVLRLAGCEFLVFVPFHLSHLHSDFQSFADVGTSV